MYTEAFFKDIQYHIKKELQFSNTSIKLAVAWFTDNELYEILLEQQKHHINVSIILSNDEINKGEHGLDFNEIKYFGGSVTFRGNSSENESLMHNKFCIIDNKTLITGSYNWSRKAQKNDENITIIKENPELIRKFNQEFHRLLSTDLSTKFNITQFLKRLSLLKEVIMLEDLDDIEFQVLKLKKIMNLSFSQDLQTKLGHIINDISTRNFVSVISIIDNILNENLKLIIYEDPLIPALKLELNNLKLQLVSLEDEIVEIEKKLRKFEIFHDRELGAIILEILKLKKDRLKKEAKDNTSKNQEYNDSKKEYSDYNDILESGKTKVIKRLSVLEEEKLKKLYRKTAFLCHPDKVPSIFKNQAEEIFNKLTEAYNKNDIEAVQHIFTFVKNKNWVPLEDQNTERITQLEELKSKISAIKFKIDEKISHYNFLIEQEVYKIIDKIENWDSYFAETKASLIEQLENLKQSTQ